MTHFANLVNAGNMSAMSGVTTLVMAAFISLRAVSNPLAESKAVL